jgi:hypothetical protein
MDIDYDKLADAIRKGGSGSGLSGDTVAELREQLAKYTKELKASSSPLQKWGKFLNGQTTEMVDMHKVMKDFERQIEETVEQEKKLLKQGKDKEAQQQREMREELVRGRLTAQGAVHYKNAQIAAGNAAVGLRNLTSQMVDASFDFVSGLQAGKSGTELLGEAAKNAAKMQSELAKTSGEAMGAFGNMIALLGFFSPAGKIGTVLKWVGAAIAFIGETLKIMGPKLSDTAVKAIDAFNVEMKHTKDAFQKMTSTGMTLAGGMTEMRNSAVKAGLDVNQFGDFVKNNTESLSHMGVGITESTKHLLDFNKKMIQGKIGEQLYKLGYDFKEQGDLLAFTNAQLIASGKSQLEIDKELLTTTLEYGKSLRVLHDITGKDAKKAMAKARDEALDMSTYATVFRKAGADGVQKLGDAFTTMPDELKKFFRQFMATEGKGMTSPEANMLDKAAGGELTKLFTGFRNDILNKNVKADTYSVEAPKRVGTFNENTKNNPKMLKFAEDIARGGLLGKGNQGLMDILALMTGMNKSSLTIGSKKTVEESIKNTKEASETTDALTTSTYKADEAVQELASEFTKLTTGPLTGFASKLADGSEALKAFKERLEELGIIDKKVVERTPEQVADAKREQGKRKGRAFGPEWDEDGKMKDPRRIKPPPENKDATKGKGDTLSETVKDYKTKTNTKDHSQLGTPFDPAIPLARIKSKSGQQATVNANLAPKFQSLIDWLDVRGYDIKDIQGFNHKKIGNYESAHSFGAALDVNPAQNPMLSKLQTDLPKEVSAYAKSIGLGWGGDWSSVKDPMHFSAQPTEGGSGGYDSGGVIGPTSRGMVGERGNMELVSGGAKITGSYDTHKLFTSMDKKLSDLVKLMEKQTHTSVKTLRAMS